MFYDETKTINACEADPSLIFELLKEGHLSLLDKIISKKTFDINVTDEDGNSIITKLLKKGQYDLVLKHMKNKNWDVNHQNNDGDTFAHILLSMNNLSTIDIYKELKRIKKFIPNIRNNEGETILDKSINSCSIYTTTKILKDKRFDSVGVFSFKKLYDTYIKSNIYGKYTKLTNLEMIVDNLDGREIAPQVKEIIEEIKSNFVTIKEEVINNKTDSMDTILSTVLES